ncbi:hypothetical protein GMOD_00001507 [Pyrenophora seminiperda CCB06]|uniref:Uncharacterized protein n=1 Tax=Pyrenophora seminiperda CCB06 TaxID=1302712 RepID=A0A3M7LZG3_9PLEO|nr:hypothetical protein GMOD_00001507 [Pyrenophora seminiperda CCB06]
MAGVWAPGKATAPPNAILTPPTPMNLKLGKPIPYSLPSAPSPSHHIANASLRLHSPPERQTLAIQVVMRRRPSSRLLSTPLVTRGIVPSPPCASRIRPTPARRHWPVRFATSREMPTTASLVVDTKQNTSAHRFSGVVLTFLLSLLQYHACYSFPIYLPMCTLQSRLFCRDDITTNKTSQANNNLTFD